MTSISAETAARGKRIGVLLIHGLCGSPAEMRFIANGLQRAGYDVECPELAGHGGTAERLAASSWQDWYRSAEEAFDALESRCDEVVVGGLSTGAVLALMLAANRGTRVAATLLFAPTLWLNGWSIPWYARLFGLVRHKWLASFIRFPSAQNNGIKDERVRAFVRSALECAARSGRAPTHTPGGAVLERRWLAEATLRCLGRVGQPALIVHPRDDDYAGLSNAWHLQRKLRGGVDMCVLEDSYHYVTVDRQRHVVLARAVEFLGRVTPAGLQSAPVRLVA
ncbi:MAG: alpha/beta fold hydrolase [Hyphomicrobium sp.]